MSKTTKKPTTTTKLNTPNFLPFGKIESMSFFQSVVNNPTLKNIGGDSWNTSLLEVTQEIDGQKMVNVEMVKFKVKILESQGFRPPSRSGKGGEKNFSPLMKETKTGINTLLGDNEFTGSDGNSFTFHSFVREYVFVNGVRKMLTTLSKGTDYIRGDGTKHTK
jgi:hypothetical protein